MSCQQLIGSLCGLAGTCKNVTPGESICVCSSGWSQNKEWNFQTSEDTFNQSVCYFNTTVVRLLYVLLLIACLLHTVFLMKNVRTAKKLRKRAIWLALGFCIVLQSLLRIAKPESGYADSILFTILYALSVEIVLYQAINYTFDYLKYVARKIQYLQGFKVGIASKVFHGMVYFSIFWFGVTSSVSLVSSVDGEIKSNLFRAMLAYFALMYVYETIFIFASLSEMITDMKTILNKSDAMRDRNVFTGHGSEFERRIMKHLPRAIATRSQFVFLGTVTFICFLIPTAKPEWLIFLTYIGPILLILHYVYSTVHLVNKYSKRKEVQSSDMDTNTNTNTLNSNGAPDLRSSWNAVSAGSIKSVSEATGI
mmetsp:Transcript_19268/g.25112  ORF Transcript_19268/g.25112 Transcript_19268/m.25112 type:complete len:366 (+) Transcript_19268:157-1254(+)|eukprot:CAMPEP_0184064350 /NCGR_PEP_ID=MMETSP0957-20130417/1894_1 /TAXON_ID=627963 /ORGANISM="Aplanochytrium sp, Strain PBS07" /LENGTH=365 /DNA_ID=CAMNT_0026361697 /DNA_START=108 /DNA_END=1205 /DNA_ORIENTATION=-